MPKVRELAEMIGLAAVILSLVFLGYELKRANDIAEAEAISSIMGEINGFVSMVSSDEELFRVWRQGRDDFKSLDGKDVQRYRTLLNQVLNAFEVMIIYRTNGLVDDEYTEYFRKDICGLLNSNEGTWNIWLSMRDGRVPSLARFIDSSCQPPGSD